VNLVKEFLEFLCAKIPNTGNFSIHKRKQTQQPLPHPEIFEEFKKRVDDLIERYREALEALAKE
jgi:hypothetical protein